MSLSKLPALELYVYYKVDGAQVSAALRAFDEASAGLSGLRPRLLRRESSADGQQTWMEIYRSVDALADEQRFAAAMAACVSGDRHIERFEPLR